MPKPITSAGNITPSINIAISILNTEILAQEVSQIVQRGKRAG
ncbi:MULTISPECIES: hypothetical protein [unclassified Buttiauxella]|nr:MULTISPECIES: hypothetical protein [unclassified Buttiauxella]